MNVVTIPKKISGAKDDLVVLPRKEYESLKARVISEISMTPNEKKALLRARKEYKAGKTIRYEGVRKELGFNRRSKRS